MGHFKRLVGSIAGALLCLSSATAETSLNIPCEAITIDSVREIERGSLDPFIGAWRRTTGQQLRQRILECHPSDRTMRAVAWPLIDRIERERRDQGAASRLEALRTEAAREREAGDEQRRRLAEQQRQERLAAAERAKAEHERHLEAMRALEEQRRAQRDADQRRREQEARDEIEDPGGTRRRREADQRALGNQIAAIESSPLPSSCKVALLGGLRWLGSTAEKLPRLVTLHQAGANADACRIARELSSQARHHHEAVLACHRENGGLEAPASNIILANAAAIYSVRTNTDVIIRELQCGWW